MTDPLDTDPHDTDPLDTGAGIPYDTLTVLRAECPVSRTESGAYFLARYDDVLGATKNLDAFQASFREPGVVVPPEEQLISEIPEPRHGKIRRIINSAIAQHRIGRVEPFARQLCHDLMDGIVARGGGDARLEGRIALEVFLERVETARVADDYTREPVPVFWANGPRRLPVVLTGTEAR
ncbi:MAG: hypothetical protein R6X23_14850 [Acidimicrobiia bacterium]